MEVPKVLVADPVSDRGVTELRGAGELDVTVKTGLKEDQLLEIIPEFSALVVRSQTKATARLIDAAAKLRVIGRAGVGVDNVDVDAATRRGVIVMNTPGGNTISTAEHAFSLLMSLARKIPQAHASIVAGKWDRKSFEGTELYDKTLAVLGMGRIGTEVARRAMAFGMRVLAYDPYLSQSRARSLQVELIENLEEVLPRADFITMHMPATAETHHMLDAARIAKCKRGVRIINCARGGLVDEVALYDALKSGQVAGAALDVYEKEPPPAEFPLRELPNVVLTPHLGASTAEAQESVGIEIAQAIRAALLQGEIRNAVNMPALDAKTLAIIGPYLALGEKMGRLLSQLAPKRCETLNINYSGKVAEVDTAAVSRAVLRGFLFAACGREVNQVNAPALAANLGIKVTESRISAPGEFTDLIEISAGGDGNTASIAGTFFGATPRLVKINNRYVEARPEGVLLLLENRDRPGIVGMLGSMLGEDRVNIAGMSLSRNQEGGEALTILNLDTPPSEAVLKKLLAEEDIRSASVIQL
ncbi:MAG TPA: phosphoglycerate dehydrogenase [Chthoniobacteraceae bacterium]|jgi:D-3-phosphoglycerate dehydrogenase|nr:phosphoglycerate dehydrogenase [Chthoniobacteraceae bacterium]